MMFASGVTSSTAQTQSSFSRTQVGATASHAVTIRIPAFAALSSGGLTRSSKAGQTQRVLLHANQRDLTVSTSTTILGRSIRIADNEQATLLATANAAPVSATDERRRNGERAFEIPDYAGRVVYVTVTR